MKNDKITIYNKTFNVPVNFFIKEKNLWLDAHEMAQIFNVDRTVVVKHVKNIYKEGELDEKSTCAKITQVAKDGKSREMNIYSLDTIISVGYRVNSKKATEFRQWATKVLKTHVIDGFTVDKSRIAANYEKFLETIEEIKKVLPENAESLKSSDTIDLIKLFANTWLSLDSYDKQNLELKKVTKSKVDLVASDLKLAIENLKKTLIKKGEATHLFATDRNKESLEGIVGNVMQSFGGKHVYGSVEEKAAHLLYFIIKNHPFADGNKRSGAFAFVWYLEQNKRLDMGKVSPSALTAFTILVAESNPEYKENIVKLIMKLIER